MALFSLSYFLLMKVKGELQIGEVTGDKFKKIGDAISCERPTI
jgi:hypothetical protein